MDDEMAHSLENGESANDENDGDIKVEILRADDM
jgi:hypothetical protein